MNRIWQRRRGMSGMFLGLMFAGALLAADSAKGSKLIEFGWDMPKTDYLRQHWQEMENTTPFDGVVFVVDAVDEQGKTNSSTTSWDKSPWKREWLNQAAADLAACQFKKFTDNFILLNVNPGSLDWFDDAGWQAMAEKAGHLAWLAKTGKCKGICLDPESYSQRQFEYNKANGHTFEETCAMARKRGAQLMTAMGKEYSDLTLISFWLFSMSFTAAEAENPQGILEGTAYGLLPAVVNGFLDTLPPAAKLVDATENAYRYSEEATYLRCYNKIRKPGRLLAPENRAKYIAQVSAGFGFYLDAYLNPPNSSYYIEPVNGSQLQALRRNLAFALKISDGYVWAYGEQCKWWPIICANVASQKTVGKGRPWEEAMPGIKQAIEQARDPQAAAVKAIAAGKAAKTLKNLAINPDFESEQPQTTNAPSLQPSDWKAGGAPAGYSTWQEGDEVPSKKAKNGFLIWDRTTGCNSKSSAKAVKVDNGCFIQKIAVKPGEVYVVEVDAKMQGQGRAGVTIRWLDPQGKWTATDCDTPLNFTHPGQDWAHDFGVVTVPDGAGFLVVLLGVTEQNTENDICWFDNLGVYRLAD